MRARRSVATSMGFTALDGLMMGRRCGALDPGVVLHLMRGRGMSVEEVEDLLYARSGLMGVSGISPDMRVLEASDDPRAAEAVALFVYRAVQEIGALAASLGGLDAVVFTAGIGENSAAVRAAISEGLGWLGATVDAEANAAGAAAFHAPDSQIGLHRIETDEEGVIARAVREVLGLDG
jgi:acetate kinase